MQREVGLPPAFAALSGTVFYVQHAYGHEYSSTCPKCGGEVHSTGEWPDRFRLFDDDHPTGWCRRCGFLWFPDSEKHTRTPEEIEQWRQEQVRREEARRRSAERALEHLQSEELWLRYHEALDIYYRTQWHKRGIPDQWLDFWQFGCRRDWSFQQDDGHAHRTSSLTIPLFDHDWQCVNVKHRLLDPPPDRPNMRYLYELKGQKCADPLFLCNPDAPLEGHVYVLEGEIKAAVTFATLDDSKMVMVGMPGTHPGLELVSQLERADRITLVMDPGAEEQAARLAGQLGARRCRILVCSEKIDDAIIAQRATAYDVRCWLQQARRAI